jgi:hypothetical protein
MEDNVSTKTVVGFSRRYLKIIYDKANAILENYSYSLTPAWLRAYNDLAASVNNMDAMLARQKMATHLFVVKQINIGYTNAASNNKKGANTMTTAKKTITAKKTATKAVTAAKKPVTTKKPIVTKKTTNSTKAKTTTKKR